MTPPPPIRIAGLRFGYDPDHEVLRGIDLTVAAGERFGIIGPSGAGKSTLLHHLNGLLLPDAGLVTVGDAAVVRERLGEVRRRVGLVFQNPDDQLFTPTVAEDVAFGPLNLGLPAGEVDRRVAAALGSMGLADRGHEPAHRLSWGERKRAALATVLAMQPQVVAFDEPFSNLDPAMVEQLCGIIRTLSATVVIVSQALLPLTMVCDRVAVLVAGEVRAVGRTGEILSDRPLLRSCGLDFHHFHDRLHELTGQLPAGEGGHRHE